MDNFNSADGNQSGSQHALEEIPGLFSIGFSVSAEQSAVPSGLNQQRFDDLDEFRQVLGIVAGLDSQQHDEEYMPLVIRIDYFLPVVAKNAAERIAADVFVFKADRRLEVQIRYAQQVQPFKILNHFQLVVFTADEVLDINILRKNGTAFFKVGRETDGLLHFLIHNIVDGGSDEHLESALIHTDLARIGLLGDFAVDDFQLPVHHVQIVPDGTQDILQKRIIGHKIRVLVDDFMLHLAPESMDQSLDLQFKIDFASVEQIVAVDPVVGEAIAQQLRLRHPHIQKHIGIFTARYKRGIAAGGEMLRQRPVDGILVADEPAFNRDADQITEIGNGFIGVFVMEIELVPDQLFLQAFALLDAGVHSDDGFRFVLHHVQKQ